jgi:iron complex outermembrane receptor protein
MLSGSYLSSAGQRDLFFPEYANPQNNNGFAVNSDQETAYHLFGSLSYHDFTLSAAYSDRYKKVPTAPSDTAFNSGQGKTEDKRGYVDLKYEHQFENDLTVMGRISYDWYPYYAVYPYANAAPPPSLIINQDLSLGQWGRVEAQITKKFFDRHTLIVGAEYQENFRQYQANYDQTPYTSYLHIDHGSRNYAFYTQGEIALGKQLLLNAGVRYDHFDSFGGTVNPRVGLIYNPWEKTTFKALYGQAFRAPNDYELSFASSTFEANPGLKPETIQTYELVYEQYLPGKLRFSAAGYHYDIDGLITQATDPANGLSRFENINRVQANGLELQLEGRYAWGLLARASYALQRAEDADTKQELSNSPRHLAKFNLSVPIYKDKLFTSIELQYNGSVITPNRKTADDFAVVNLTLFSQKLVKGLEVSASIYNLLDTRYSVSSSGNTLQDTIQQNGRSFRLKLTYNF